MAEERSELARVTLSVIFIGGLVSFGVIGIFVGPVILAVAFTLLDDWVAEQPGIAAETAVPSGPDTDRRRAS